jgi:hypothetical protein
VQLLVGDVGVAADGREVGVTEVGGDEAGIACLLAEPGRGGVACGSDARAGWGFFRSSVSPLRKTARSPHADGAEPIGTGSFFAGPDEGSSSGPSCACSRTEVAGAMRSRSLGRVWM